MVAEIIPIVKSVDDDLIHRHNKERVNLVRRWTMRRKTAAKERTYAKERNAAERS